MRLPPMVSNPAYSYPFERRHRFPMEKFGLLNQYLSERSLLTETNLFRPGRARADVLAQAHCPDYITAVSENRLDPKAARRLGLPWSEGLIKRSWISPNGTLLTAQLALRHGIACHLAGGTHHAHYNFGSGFCVFNDLAVAASTLLSSGQVSRVLVFDCDVHQGDGTATILRDTPGAYTCSLHCEKNFPVRKAESDLDINIPKGVEDDRYLEILAEGLAQAIAAAKPEIVLYDAGVDIYTGDPLGLLNVSEDGIRQRDRYVLTQCAAAGIPVATVIGGGYDDNRLALAARHAIVVEEAQRCFAALG
ncbi:MAG: histone deacetylase family protein [Spongiibacter sp.]|uniref:histone deacetylase family protein n=1 Tax=Spongiibacter tropicus TaxID=454602 RepID=UPI003A994BF6